jgi:hypothetical protein
MLGPAGSEVITRGSSHFSQRSETWGIFISLTRLYELTLVASEE